MVKKIIQTIFLLFVLAAVFSGCSTQVEENQAPVVESDDSSVPSEPVSEEDEVNSIVEDELVVDEAEADIGDLI